MDNNKIALVKERFTGTGFRKFNINQVPLPFAFLICGKKLLYLHKTLNYLIINLKNIEHVKLS